MNDRKWLFRGLAFQLSAGFLIAMFISQIGSLVFYGEASSGLVPALFVLVFYVGLLTVLIRRADRKRVIE